MGPPIPIILLCLSSAVAIAQESSPPPAAMIPALNAYSSMQNQVTLADGRKIHLTCMGRGSPTVIFTSGMGDWGAIWSQVQPRIAQRTRACTWDRAGFGFSSGSGTVQTVDHTTDDLEAALAYGKVAGPYVLVGHSMGAYETLLFADRRRSEVVGIVLVDGSVPQQSLRFKRVSAEWEHINHKLTQRDVERRRQCAADARNGKLRAGAPDPSNCRELISVFPKELAAALTRVADDPARYDAQASLVENFSRDGELVVNARRAYGDLPLIVLSATDPDPPSADTAEIKLDQKPLMAEIQRAHADIAALSKRGVHRRVPGTTHYIQLDKPNVVIEAIDEVLDQSRRK